MALGVLEIGAERVPVAETVDVLDAPERVGVAVAVWPIVRLPRAEELIRGLMEPATDLDSVTDGVELTEPVVVVDAL